MKFYKLKKIFYCKSNRLNKLNLENTRKGKEKYKIHLSFHHPETDTLNILVYNHLNF